MAKILVVDDEIGIRELLLEILRDEGHDVLLAENAAMARNVRSTLRPDLVLLDIWMPDVDGITLLKEWAANGQLSMPVIMMSGHGTIDTAVEAVRLGATDFLEKPIALQKLLSSVKRGLARQHTKVRTHLTLSAFARSLPLKELRKRLEQITEKSRILLLRVTTGSLAELCARSLQTAGSPWLDLGLLTHPLEIQALETARGGILFVDELANLNRAQQKNLAFALDRLEKYDLRIVVASTQSADQLSINGWEPALLKRLYEVCLAPPALADVRDEIPEMAAQILQHLIEANEVPMHRFATDALNALRHYPWSGGIAELKTVIKSLALAALDEEIHASEVSRLLVKPIPASIGLPLDLPLREAREGFERIYFEHHLEAENGNMTRLAEKTGLERTHLYRKLKQLGIPVGRRSESYS